MAYRLFIIFLASFLIWFIAFGALVFLSKARNLKLILFVFFSVVLAWIVSEMVKSLFFTVRPFKVNGFPALTLTNHSDSSFPSTHTAFAFALATAIYIYDKKIGLLVFVLSFFVGLGRVVSNVHYPIDILGGAALGIFIPLFLEGLFFKEKK